MKFNLKFKAIGAAAAVLVAGALPTAANADAIAQSILNVTGFTLTAGNGALGGGGAFTGVSITASTTADADATLDLINNSGVAIAGGEIAQVGAGYAPGVRMLQPGGPTGTYAGSQGQQLGSALLPGGANATVDNTVSLFPTGDGSARGNVNLNASFDIIVGATGQNLQIAFNADSFLRGYLSADPGFATAAYSWTISLTKTGAGGGQVFSWTPNGQALGIVGGTEYADAFSLTDTVSAVIGGDDFQTNNASAAFEAETNTLALGSYRLSLRHTGTADARLLPEPGALALLGTLLFGAAVATRRRNSGK
jgi:hypothetical protein